MKIKEITEYKGRHCAELENGLFILSDGEFELIVCERVPQGMKIIAGGIVGGKTMRTEDDFRWCVEHMDEERLKRHDSVYVVKIVEIYADGRLKNVEIETFDFIGKAQSWMKHEADLYYDSVLGYEVKESTDDHMELEWNGERVVMDIVGKSIL